MMCVLDKSLDGEAVRVESETAYHALAGARNHGVVSELLTLVYVADVHLDDGCCQRADAVLQCYAGVCVCSCIEDDAIGAEAHLLQAVDEQSFHIALVILDVDGGIALAHLQEIVLEGAAAVYPRFTGSEQVEVGTVND